MEDHHKELEGELELDDSEVLALTQAQGHAPPVYRAGEPRDGR